MLHFKQSTKLLCLRSSSNFVIRYFHDKNLATKVCNHFVKVKQSHYRPERIQSPAGGLGSHISRQSAREGGKVVSPRHRLPLLPRIYSW
jgi:ABC-type cobalamin/Fe3+-siderophores transport system ATPase subunit